MRFWKRLSWLASVTFVLVLVAACLFADPDNPAGGPTVPVPRSAPIFK